jgi:hypothetical protein
MLQPVAITGCTFAGKPSIASKEEAGDRQCIFRRRIQFLLTDWS